MKPDEQRALPAREPGLEIAALPRLDEELERAGIDGFDPSLIPLAEWL